MQIEALARLRRNQRTVADTRGEAVAVNPCRDCEMSMCIERFAGKSTLLAITLDRCNLSTAAIVCPVFI